MKTCTTCARLEVVLLPTAIEIRCKTTGRVIIRLEMPEAGCQHWDGKDKICLDKATAHGL